MSSQLNFEAIATFFLQPPLKTTSLASLRKPVRRLSSFLEDARLQIIPRRARKTSLEISAELSAQGKMLNSKGNMNAKASPPSTHTSTAQNSREEIEEEEDIDYHHVCQNAVKEYYDSGSESDSESSSESDSEEDDCDSESELSELPQE